MLALLATLLLVCIGFATTVVSVPAASPLPLGFERMSPLPFRAQVGRISSRIAHIFNPAHTPVTNTGRPLTVAFYTSWTDDSAPALARHINEIDWVAPTLLQLGGNGHVAATEDAPLRRILATSLHRPLVIPVIQNVIGGKFDGELTARLIHDPRERTRLIGELSTYLDRTGDNGIMFDFEDMTPAGLADFRALISETRSAFAPRHRLVTLTVPIDNADWSLPALAKVADRLVLMAYDEHWQGGTPGPIASNAWFADRLSRALHGLPPGKAIIALGNYGYDWHEGKANARSVEEAWLESHDSGATPVFDKASGNPGFSFMDNGVRHDVWMLDAAVTWNQMQILNHLGVQDIAMWRLGSEDPGFWPTLNGWRQGNRRPELSAISQDTNVDVEGQGEILRITSTPQPGSRQIAFYPQGGKNGGVITGESYTALPTPYVVNRTGVRPKLVSLTFDDGPDKTWTPQILSILEQYHVPATFFIVGENGVSNRDLLERMARDGDEIGNHSYTHPNMADEAPSGIKLELNATQRLIEAYTGRSTRLFRAPYFGDAEPTTADELTPALIAQQHGYTVVGLHVDPGDWKHPGAQAIVDRTLQQVANADATRSANIVLLHDGGGDRSQTIAALPQIITGLERMGYRIVPTATLAGLDREQVMPRVEGFDLMAVRFDVAIFSGIAMMIVAINWTFFFAIALGIARSLLLTGLAMLPGSRRAPPVLVNETPSLVTVIIPAYNEERVIEASVRRVLESDYPHLQVIVVDDGSKDRTSAIVAEVYGGNPRVELLTLPNGGKAKALNRALELARGEIIVALDADTQFERLTISRLERWFVDQRIGAVAGNAKVGNRINLVTRWQGIEYVTAQNIERRALTRFNAIMVVPGAVGAWRAKALAEVGGYPENTLAEDQDLTIAIQRKGWKVAYDEEAVAWTEAPESFGALSRQRFRWAFGTLQCLWKHRRVMREGRPGGLAWIGMPQAWLFQIVFAMISPAIDLALLVSISETVVRVFQHGWAQTQTDVLRMGAYWIGFSSIDLLCGWIAYRMDVREMRFPAFLLLGQRFIYRQLMYSVVIRAVAAALAGLGIGWGKQVRSGRVETQEAPGGNSNQFALPAAPDTTGPAAPGTTGPAPTGQILPGPGAAAPAALPGQDQRRDEAAVA